jgi:hypothetical protein
LSLRVNQSLPFCRPATIILAPHRQRVLTLIDAVPILIVAPYSKVRSARPRSFRRMRENPDEPMNG